MSPRADERIDELIALAVLGELTDAEERELDALLAGDDESTHEMDEAMETAAMLHAAVSEAPPAGLRASVLAAIASTTQNPAEPSWVDEPPAPSTRVTDLQERRRRRRWVPAALSAAAALVLLAGVGIVLVRDDSLSVEERAVVEAENVIDADDAVARTLEGQLGGTLTVVHSPGEEAIVIDGEGLPVLGEDRAFVLWFVDDDGATPVQTFQPDSSGDVLVRVDDVDPTDFVLGVSEEDAGGAETPSDILASA